MSLRELAPAPPPQHPLPDQSHTFHLHCVLWAPVLDRGRGRGFQLVSIQVFPFLLAVPETENQAVELGRVGAGAEWESCSPSPGPGPEVSCPCCHTSPGTAHPLSSAPPTQPQLTQTFIASSLLSAPRTGLSTLVCLVSSCCCGIPPILPGPPFLSLPSPTRSALPCSCTKPKCLVSSQEGTVSSATSKVLWVGFQRLCWIGLGGEWSFN